MAVLGDSTATKLTVLNGITSDGSQLFNIGTADNTSDKKFIISGNNRFLSLGGGGIQAYNGAISSTATTTLYLNYNGGAVSIGGAAQANISIKGNITPQNDVTYSLGSSTLRWANVYSKVLRLQGASTNPTTSDGARIEFSYDNGSNREQPVYISYTPNDSYRAPAGLKILGGPSATPAWLEVEGQVYASTFNGALNGTAATASRAGTAGYAVIAGSAEKLTTARNIWGHSFDGSANISGNLIDVGPGLYLPTGQSVFQFLTSTGGAAIGKYGRLLLSDNYSQGDLTNYRLYVNGGNAYLGGNVTITGSKISLIGVGEGLEINTDSNYFGSNADARTVDIVDINPGAGSSAVDGGLVFRAIGRNSGTDTTQELLRIRNHNGSADWKTGEFQWKTKDVVVELGTTAKTWNIAIAGNANTATTAGYATTAARASTAGYATTAARATTAGYSITAANATTAGKLGTANVGTEYKPIYLVNGVATANHAFIPETGGTFTGDVNFNGNVSLNNETTADSLTAGNLLVNGAATFVQTINGNIESANKLGTTTVGSNFKAIYLNNGIATTSDHEFAGGYLKTNADLNTLYDSGFYSAPGGSVTNYPTGGSAYANLIVSAYRKPSGNTTTDYAWQLGNFTQNSDRMWYRTSQASSWRAWRQIVNIATNTAVGNTSTPVYVNADGAVQALSYTIAKSVPSTAVFTDTLVKQTAKTDNVNYKLLMGANSNPTSGTAYEAVYDSEITINPSTHNLQAGIYNNSIRMYEVKAWAKTGPYEAGWKRVCALTSFHGYGIGRVYINGTWLSEEPTLAAFEISFSHSNYAHIKQTLGAKRTTPDQVRLVYSGTGGKWYFDIHIPARTASGATGDRYVTFIGRFTVSEKDETTNYLTEEPTTLTVTRNIVGTQDQPTITVNLASTTASAFTGENLTTGITGTLAIGHGGTGATTTADARTNLEAAKRSNSVYFVVGGASDTAGNWTGEIDSEVTELYDGLTILYSPKIAGVSNSTDRTLTNDNATTVSLRHTCLKILGVWKPCYYQVGNISNQTDNRLTTHYAANSVITFVYRTTANAGAGGWVAAADYNSDAPNYRQLDIYFRPYAATEAIYRYKICALDQDNRLVPLTITNQTNGTNIDKTQTAKPFKPDNFWLYNSTTTTNANSVTPAQVLYKMFGDWASPQYTFNTTIPAYTLTYLKGSFDTTTGLFTLDQTSHTSWQINVPTNTASISLATYFTSGSYYILMGGSYSSANYFTFFEENPMYYFDGTNLKKVSQTATGFSTTGTTNQFWRGDNTWSNALTHAGDTTLGIDASTSIIGQSLKTLHLATKNAGSGTGITAGQTAGLTFGVASAAYAGIYYQSSGSYGSRLYFATTDLFADGAKARMMIDPTGKVGIGTVSPSSKLHVNGDTTTTSLRVDGDTTITGTLVLSKTTDAAGGSDAKPALIVGGASAAQHIEIDANEILSKSNGTTPSTLYLQDGTGAVQVAGSGGLTVNNLTASQAVVTDANKKLVSRGIRNNTAAGALGWTSASTDITLVTTNTIAYWNGAYTNTSSNLKYSANGEIMGLGTAQTVSGTKTFSAIQKFTNTTDAAHSTDTAAAVSVSGGVSVAKRVAAKEVKIDNGSTTKGVTMQYDSTLEVLNFVFA